MHQSLPHLLCEPSPELGFAPRLPGTGTFSGTFFITLPDLALHQRLPDLLRNLRNLFRKLLQNLTWLCTKASHTFSANLLLNPVTPDLALHQGCLKPSPEPSSEPYLTWLCTKASQTFSGTFGTFSRTSLNLTRRLHQCTPELF